MQREWYEFGFGLHNDRCASTSGASQTSFTGEENMMWQMYAAALRSIKREEANENVEWIALAAIILVMLVAVGSQLKSGGTTIGDFVVTQIQRWIQNWSPD
jgi:hypothetical protein